MLFSISIGMKYIHENSFVKLDRCAATFLMGCSNGSLKQRGCNAPEGTPLSYLFTNSSVIIANLWEVTDRDIIRFSKAMLNSWMQDSIPSCSKYEEKLRVVSFIPKARRSYKLPTLVEATIVSYGMPT
ncbi:hypothetical protein KSP39_PZI016368 [Platanthera zijinensis]|uniref:Separase n=1 Tax=Platanthera zijinensis TaxID=2320716 RepID=A0AAP0B7L5_9ASPA